MWLVLSVWALCWVVVHVPGGMYSWHYFVTGGTLLRRWSVPGGGLHLFAVHPELQMGPLPIAVAAVLTLAGGDPSASAAVALSTALGLVNLYLAVRAAAYLRGRPVRPVTVLLAGAVLVPVWSELAVHYVHLDDVLAMTATAAAMLALAEDRRLPAAVLLAAAADSKPWAVPFAVMLLVPGARRATSIGVFVLATAVPWLPFLLADPRTLSLGAFSIANAPDSALRALGVSTATTPFWDRPAQLVLAVLLGAWCVRRRAWAMVPLVAVAARMLLDPGTYPYYTSSLALAAVFADLLARRSLVPWYSFCVTAWYLLDRLLAAVSVPAAQGAVRVAFLVALLAVGCLATAHRRPPTSLPERIPVALG